MWNSIKKEVHNNMQNEEWADKKDKRESVGWVFVTLSWMLNVLQNLNRTTLLFGIKSSIFLSPTLSPSPSSPLRSVCECVLLLQKFSAPKNIKVRNGNETKY